MTMLFEVADLKAPGPHRGRGASASWGLCLQVASPATVSRCGMARVPRCLSAVSLRVVMMSPKPLREALQADFRLITAPARNDAARLREPLLPGRLSPRLESCSSSVESRGPRRCGAQFTAPGEVTRRVKNYGAGRRRPQLRGSYGKAGKDWRVSADAKGKLRLLECGAGQLDIRSFHRHLRAHDTKNMSLAIHLSVCLSLSVDVYIHTISGASMSSARVPLQ